MTQFKVGDIVKALASNKFFLERSLLPSEFNGQIFEITKMDFKSTSSNVQVKCEHGINWFMHTNMLIKI